MGAKRDQESCHSRKGGYESPKQPPESLPRIAEATIGNVQAKMAVDNTKSGGLVLDPDNPFEAILIKMVKTHRAKKKDYAGDFHPNQNFYDTATQLQLTGGHAVEALIATKQARLKVLLPQLWTDDTFKPNNEGIEDTLLDRAVYAVIAYTIWQEGGYSSATPPSGNDSFGDYIKRNTPPADFED